ncbi:MAG: DUF3592 domain-containing protein [Terriglobales bacterium]
MGWEQLLPHPADFLLGWIIRRARKQRSQQLEAQARTWPQAQGTVSECRVKRAGDPPDRWYVWQVELTFSYVANGEYYSGTSLLPPETEGEAAELAQRWKDRKLLVRYFPEDASKSVVLMQDQTVDTAPPKCP